MNVSDKTQQELTRIRASLSRDVLSARPEEWRQIARKTIRQIDSVIEQLEMARPETNRLNGNGHKSI
jgi:hypothetical protein